MKKSICVTGLIITLLASLFVLTGCGDKKSDDKKTLEYYDEKSGNSVSFEYPDDSKFEIVEEFDIGAFKNVHFVNEKLNISGNMYFIQEYSKSYERNKDLNRDADNFNEYNANGYDGFSYTQSNGSTIHNKILLIDDEEEGLSLYMYLEKNDYSKESTLLDSFNDDVFQDFLKSIKYEKK